MGQVMPVPVTTKESGDGIALSKGLSWGYSCMQGWRISMEDAHFAVPTLGGDGWSNTAAFGVMDGHGGSAVASFCERHLPVEIASGPSKDARDALVSAFHRIDELLDEGVGLEVGPTPSSTNPDWVGCTCVVCLVQPEVLVVANAGDSRAVLSRRGQAVPLSEDHKPNLPVEHERIRRAGGSVERQQVGSVVQYRVNGNLNLSRSIGDLEYKKNPLLPPSEQIICSTPDVLTFKREADDEFLLLACDGIWDVLGSQEAVDFVNERLPQWLKNGWALSGIMEEMLDRCISPDLALTNGLGGDNMTAVLVVFSGAPVDDVSDGLAEVNIAKRSAGSMQLSRTGAETSAQALRREWCVAASEGESGMVCEEPPALEEAVVVPVAFCGCKASSWR
mmetsp:Transcript_41255/g.95517  ORF Transcript_41255/g.95517 Transcript_41255/m.95517 type:complete len:391 (+) Transcript_41255:114-1286(+)